MAANKRKHLSAKERFCIEKMLRVSNSFSEISRTLSRGLSTVSEEVNANGGRDKYDACKAERRAYWKQYRKKKECKKVAMNSHLSRFVESKLELGWSPETISCRLLRQSGLPDASAKAIRKFISSRGSLERFLFWHRNDHRSGRKRKKDVFLQDNDRKFIDDRPFEANYGYGHWEGDFIVSKHNSSVLLVLVERYSKLLRLAILPNRNNDLVNQTVVSLLEGYMAATLTLDNDIAFSKWRQLEEMSGAKIYFCHPYHSWEKGLVENTNRWIRQFVPKRTDLQMISKEELKAIEDWFNHTPRQCLNGSTAYEIVMSKECQRLVSSLEVNLPRLRIWG